MAIHILVGVEEKGILVCSMFVRKIYVDFTSLLIRLATQITYCVLHKNITSVTSIGIPNATKLVDPTGKHHNSPKM